jgi:hypothetical protein
MSNKTEQELNEEHIKVLYSLGLLDDIDNWNLYKEQEQRYEEGMDELDKYKSRNSAIL